MLRAQQTGMIRRGFLGVQVKFRALGHWVWGSD